MSDKVVSVRMPENLHRELDRLARRNTRSLNAEIRRILKEAVQRENKR